MSDLDITLTKELCIQESFRNDLGYLLKKYGYELHWTGVKEAILTEISPKIGVLDYE